MTAALEALSSVAPTTRHALYLLYVLAVFVLALETQVHPAVYAAVGAFLIWIGASGCGEDEWVASGNFGPGWVRRCARIGDVHSLYPLLWAGGGGCGNTRPPQ